ncbi:MAG: epoxyqueuosine reductase QueH [Opitutales bacterium]|nr:epoxyqueuosine reductase QueH [Opitutales bacterium]
MKILLHACCGICAGHCVSTLLAQGHSVTLFYSNANIAPHEEFEKRLAALQRLAEHFGVPVIVDRPDHGEWLEQVAKGFENEPERGARCPRCFGYSLARTANFAREHGFDAFTTTLTVSPHKNSPMIFAVGKSLGGNAFLEEDFKKKDGFKNTNAIARALELYRQRYCGCEFSLRDALKASRERK